MLDIPCVQALSTVFALLDIFSVLLVFWHLCCCRHHRLISVQHRKKKRKNKNILWSNYGIHKFHLINLIWFTFVFTNSRSMTFIIFVLTYSSICKISIVWISTKPFCWRASQQRCTCSMHGENEQNRPPGIQSTKKRHCQNVEHSRLMFSLANF